MAQPDIRKPGHTGSKPSGDRGPHGPTFRREFEVGGKRAAVELSVKIVIVKGDQLAHGEKVWFWLGTETQKHQKPLEESDGAAKKLWELPTVKGYALSKIDLSTDAHKAFTHITAVHGNYGWEDTKPLPIPDVMPAGSTSTSSAKPEEKKKEAAATKVQRLHMARGVYTFLILASTKTKKKIRLDHTVPIQTRKFPCDDDASWTREYNYETDGKGLLELQVKVEDGDRGDLFVCEGHLRSAPQYLAHPNRPQMKQK